ncbi:MAG: hypothetical protein A2X25_04790 [Chloroflexi bacterium GWB2_49_20]|nr:MAG: hypothetical protein A2X25_04790 [Chloroflexi bacterium GWB2_49_20]OGN80504.1 MAG: hypothetical protein A2X26_11900 [Chloroflexi bacterium GWC2_49_37]OGN83339.1 MAG: hypothetical protein A2X27_12075 [Chloroflexi bacterium GWD2_49_16]HCC78173.1 hypothetical protein [Anaerolineae bacterium]
MRKINPRRVFLIASALSLVLVYILLWLRMLYAPVQYTGTDFVPFYAAAQIARNEGPSQIYDLQLQQQYEKKLGNFEIQLQDVRIYLNPPFVVPLVSVVTLPNFVTSLVLWELLMAFHLLLGTGLLFLLIRTHFSWQIFVVFLLGVLLFFPGYKSVLIGQNSAMLYLGACLWVFGLFTHKDWLAGIGLALMTVRPHIALPLALPFIFKRRAVWWWFLLGAGVLAVFSLAYTGLDGIMGFLKMLTISGDGTNTTTGEKSMVNLLGVLVRLFPGIPASIFRWVGWGAYFVTIIGLCGLWIKTPEIQSKQIGLAILVTTFTAPHMHMHDLVLWSIPLVLILLSVQHDPVLIRKVAALPWWLSMAFLFCFFSPILEAVIPYLILIFLILVISIPEKILTLSASQPRDVS